MSSKTAVIKVETPTAVEQQENLKNIRRSAKVLQKGSKDKENLVRKPFGGLHKGFIRSKSANELSDGEIKRKKLVAHSVQTGSQTALAQIDEEAIAAKAAPANAIVANDGDAVLSEHYWRDLAEAHRMHLEQHLRHNEQLHGAVHHLKLRLANANEQLNESKDLVEVLTELLEETESASKCGVDETAASSSSMDAVEAPQVTGPIDEEALAE